jgi:hypothetical protein
VEIAHFRGSRNAKGCLHYLFRRDAPPKPLSVRDVQFPLIYSLKINPGSIQNRSLAILTDPIQDRSRIDPAGIIAKPATVHAESRYLTALERKVQIFTSICRMLDHCGSTGLCVPHSLYEGAVPGYQTRISVAHGGPFLALP